MKQILVAFMMILFITNIALAQAPQAIPYQAVARGANGVVIANKAVSLRFTILQNSATPYPSSNPANLEYQETQSAISNALGMIMVNIGQGVASYSGSVYSFSNINWGSGTKFVQVELDTSNTGNAYTIIGSQQLMSVPDALNAGNGVPVGTSVAFGGDVNAIPSGWVLCDGSLVGTKDPKYTNLYNAIGTAWGKYFMDTLGVSNNSFFLPDLRGQFLRGVSGPYSSADPESASRTALHPGGNTGNIVGSYQADIFGSHNHAIRLEYGTYNNLNSGPGGQYNQVTSSQSWGYTSAGTNISYSGGTETRPKNAYVNYIIKL